MVLVKSNIEQKEWGLVNQFDDIPEDHIVRFVDCFVDEFFDDSIDDDLDKKPGRAIFPKKILLKIVVYGRIDRVNSTEVLEDMVKNHRHYQFLAECLKPSARTIRRFKEEYGYLCGVIMESTLKYAKNKNLTDFHHVAIDGTVIKANNSNYNILKLEDIDLILDLLKLSSDDIDAYLKENKNDKIRKSAYDFLKNTKSSVEDKVSFLNKLKDVLFESKQSSVGLVDNDARWMINKKNTPEISFNVQAAVDYQSGLIVSLDLVQDPTDTNQLIPELEQIKNNLGHYPECVSADYGYWSHNNLKFLNDQFIDGYIPNQKQARKNKGKKHKNPYHKDYFEYNEEKDQYECPKKEILPYQRTYTYENKSRRLYYTQKCKSCLVKNECTKSNIKIISEYGDELEQNMIKKINSTEGKKEYNKRMPTVEPVFGVLKKQDNLNELEQRGKEKIQNELHLMASSYNIKQLYSQRKKHQKENTLKQLRKLLFFEKNFQEKFPKFTLKIMIFNLPI